MNKSTNKRNKYNTLVVMQLAKKWGVTTRFVTMSLRADRESETAEKLKKEYKRLVKQVEAVLE
ncbi:hypothetical protein CXF68_08855 [Tenacibaculum sp. Bg11-29]|uniref:hypothetical protein n=1 Tax=Tenacibaculum sp. Bg11-29 TaxID=2058306 RepID=UPI000C341CB5|nr:hypothetical protein [Tenacibaculum sp. Bg11-29]PKH50788.1 hypothetical protein CXF68_08855 [Tenacibaculum sp. Bg11-29]